MAATALSSWALLIWQSLQDEGLDPRAIFEQVGLDPSVLSDGGGRYETEAMQALWRQVHKRVENPAFGIVVGRRWSPTSFHALGYAWLASRNLQDAMQRFCRYAKVVNTELETSLSRRGIDYSFCIESQADWALSLPLLYDAAFVALLRMIRLLLGEQFVPLEVRLRSQAAGSKLLLEAELGAKVTYGCDNSEMIISRNDVERELPGASAELLRVNEHLLQEYLSRLNLADISHQVTREVIELLPSGEANEQKVAANLNMSGRSLQRRLSESETSFSHILQTTRQQMAEHYIREAKLSLSEIAYLLGFSDQANFNRAFKRWHDCSPSAYRKEVQQISA